MEFTPWVNLYDYPSTISNLKPNVLVAPLYDNTFNKAKSDLKYIESCCYGIPFVGQDMCTYENAPYRFNTGDEMIDHITDIMGNYSKYKQISRDGRAVADSRWLESDDNIDKYHELYAYPYKDPKRKLLNSLAENQ